MASVIDVKGTFVDTCIARVPTAENVVSATSAGANPVIRELDWSHSEIFTTSYEAITGLEDLNVPDLTTVHTPDPSCVNRWVFLPISHCRDDNGTDNVVWSVNHNRLLVPDPSYARCQLYGTSTYSPGICPSGQTIAEITAYESSAANGLRTHWQASCCRCGMNFGYELAHLCLSSFSTPLSAYAAITTTTTLATGLAVADPVIVAWQIDDVGTFPSEYVESLVARYSVAAPAGTSTPTINALEPTTAPVPSSSSTNIGIGAQVGIGIGVTVAAALVGGLLILWCLRRRRKSAGYDVVIPEMKDQDFTESQCRWYHELDAEAAENELDSKPVHELPQPPAELEAHGPFAEDAKVALEGQRNSLEAVRNDDCPLERA